MVDPNILAQAAPVATEPLSWVWQKIAEYGLLGAMFLLVGFVLYKRDKDLTAERHERLEDAKSLRSMIESSTESRVMLTAAVDEQNKLVEKLIAGQQEILRAIAEHRQ